MPKEDWNQQSCMISPNVDSSMISLEALPKAIEAISLGSNLCKRESNFVRGGGFHGFEHHHKGKLDEYMGIPLRILFCWGIFFKWKMHFYEGGCFYIKVSHKV